MELTGADGLPGADGVDGLPGADGADGLPGADGVDGLPGADGADELMVFQVLMELMVFQVLMAIADGLPGADGVDGDDGKTILNGTSAPASEIGTDGDFYINTTEDEIYGPKAGGAWGSPTSLVGADGADGVDGLPGADGADGDPAAMTIQTRAGNAGAAAGTVIDVDTISFNSDNGFGVEDLGSGEVLINLGSSFAPWLVDGQTTLSPTGEEPIEFIAGDGITITTNAAADPKEISFSASGGVTTLAGLTDTTLTTLVDGQVLTYDTTNGWQNETQALLFTDDSLSGRTRRITAGTITGTSGSETISGGSNNSIDESPAQPSGSGHTISGGVGNTISNVYGSYASVAFSGSITIAGGENNIVQGIVVNPDPLYYDGGMHSTISGGYSNTISGAYSTIIGGIKNTASGTCSTVGGAHASDGGFSGSFAWHDGTTFSDHYGDPQSGSPTAVPNAPNQFAIKAAGGLRLVPDLTRDGTTTPTGYVLTADADGVGTWQAIPGLLFTGLDATGSTRRLTAGTATGDYSTLSGGSLNVASGSYSFIGGGNGNQATNNGSTIAGGSSNKIYGLSTLSVIVGGSANVIGNETSGNSYDSFIGGGWQNKIGEVDGESSGGAVIGGGWNNKIKGNSPHSVMGGGQQNEITGNHSTLSGGSGNVASGSSVVIGGGAVTCNWRLQYFKWWIEQCG